MNRSACLLGAALAAVALCVASSAHGAPARPRHLTPAAATGALGLDLLRKLPAGNTVLSPDSVATAVAMAGTGAAGGTATQIRHTLHLSAQAELQGLGTLNRAVLSEQRASAHGDPEAPTLDVVDGLFLQQGFSVGASFLSGLQGGFGAPPQLVDFENDPAGATRTVNDWVSIGTHGVIPQLLPTLPRTTQLVLANAIYLKAAWRTPFPRGQTSPASFHRPGGTSSAPFMHETETLRYGRGHGYAAVDLPYRASTLSLLVVLPRPSSDLASLQRSLDERTLARIARGLAPRPVAVSLPRFHLRLGTTLNAPLAALGMPVAFSEGADFSGITKAVKLHIGEVAHAADLAVDERGTIATAATVVTLEPTSGRGFLRPPVSFVADHPFLFFLRDDRTGAVLFAGRLVDPSAAPG